MQGQVSATERRWSKIMCIKHTPVTTLSFESSSTYTAVSFVCKTGLTGGVIFARFLRTGVLQKNFTWPSRVSVSFFYSKKHTRVIVELCAWKMRALGTIGENILFSAVPRISWSSNRTGTSFDDEKGRLNSTSSAQFAPPPLVKPVVCFSSAVVNRRSLTAAKSA